MYYKVYQEINYNDTDTFLMKMIHLLLKSFKRSSQLGTAQRIKFRHAEYTEIKDKVRQTHEHILQKGNEIFSKIVLRFWHLTRKGYLFGGFLSRSGGWHKGFMS